MKKQDRYIDYISAFYKQRHSEESLIKGIDSLLGSHPDLRVYSFPVYINADYFQKLTANHPQFSLESESKEIFLFTFSFETREAGQKKRVSGKLFIVKNKDYENIYTVISIESSFFFSRGLLPFFAKNFPRISLTFITHKRLKNLLIDFRDKNKLAELTIVRTTTYSRVGKKIMPSVNWPEFSIEKAFEWVEDENGWFQNLAFKFKKRIGPKIEVSISRKGILKTNGLFSSLYASFLSPISKTVYENIKFFSLRARRDNKERDIRPLAIDFGYDKFTDLEENKRFINAMATMKASSVSVVHGNPYIHLSLFDYFDGSSFDLWVLSSDKIVIVPQLKASFQAIKRLMNHIFDNYAEGEMQDFEVANEQSI